MKYEIHVPDYDADLGVQYLWENNFNITVTIDDNKVHIVANKFGLISLAKQLFTLAQDSIPSGTHMHYDDMNSLEEDSTEMIIEKREV